MLSIAFLIFVVCKTQMKYISNIRLHTDQTHHSLTPDTVLFLQFSHWLLLANILKETMNAIGPSEGIWRLVVW